MPGFCGSGNLTPLPAGCRFYESECEEMCTSSGRNRFLRLRAIRLRSAQDDTVGLRERIATSGQVLITLSCSFEEAFLQYRRKIMQRNRNLLLLCGHYSCSDLTLCKVQYKGAVCQGKYLEVLLCRCRALTYLRRIRKGSFLQVSYSPS